MDAVDAYRLLIADVYELAGVSRDTSERLAAEVGQTAARWHVLSAASEAPQTVPAIARRLGLTRQSVQRVVHDLCDAGLVELRTNPAHARSPLVALTAAGTSTLAKLWAASERSRADLLQRAGVTAEQLIEARRTIRALLDAFAATGSDG